jgi:cytochrome c oxidase assembly protein subunit 15
VEAPTVGLTTFRRLAAASAAGLGLLVVSGGLVRLTGSGLGCPDWPSCARTTFVGPLSFHKDVEFGNRIVSALVTVVVLATFLALVRLRPRRRDLIVPASILAAGMVVEVVVGGLVVIYHLWPPLVMVHFLVSEGLVVAAAVLFIRSSGPPGRAVPVVSDRFLALSRLVVTVTAVVLAVGTAVTGSGPDGGSRGVARLPLPYRGTTEFHATLVAFLIGLIAATVFATWIAGAPAGVVRRAEVLLVASAAQAAVGYAQFFLRVPPGLVDLHLAGATVVLVAAVSFHLGLFERVPVGQGPGQPPDTPLPGDGPAAASRLVSASLPGEAQSSL